MLRDEPAGRGEEGEGGWLSPSATASCRCCLTSRLNVPNAGAWQGLFKHVAQAVGCAKAPRRRRFSGFRRIPPPLLFASRLKSHPQFRKSTRSKSVSFAQGQPDSGRCRTQPTCSNRTSCFCRRESVVFLLTFLLPQPLRHLFYCPLTSSHTRRSAGGQTLNFTLTCTSWRFGWRSPRVDDEWRARWIARVHVPSGRGLSN